MGIIQAQWVVCFSCYGSLFLEKKKIWKKEKFNALKAANLKLQQIQRILWNFAVEEKRVLRFIFK
jgi:hypothetical protein